MKYLAIICMALILTASCSKEKSPEGPSDIRIKNLTTLAFDEVSIDTSGGVNEYDAVAAGQYSDYKRFDKAYPKAEINVMIGGESYSTGTQNYNYQVVLGQGKFTYEVYISDPVNKVLSISRVIPEAPLD
ncbi:MAG: hypothetical protein RBS37_10010 [Bacteroidales bacterium]|jgi:hypothetical protein|nr:hypothetical protein [Bacteroidales bacterium]